MKKRMLAILLAVMMVVGLVPVLAEGTGAEITVSVSVSRYGEILKDKSGNDMAYLPVTLTGKDSYTLDDAFLAAHIAYCEDGADGYQSVYDERYDSISVTKMWGDTSGKFGYQVNGGTQSVGGGTHPIEDGDRVDIALYKNSFPDTEAYAIFDVVKKNAYPDEIFELTLSCVSGFDESWNNVFSPCEGATITVNGTETTVVTDANGKATITLDAVGDYIISAKKSKTLEDETNPEATPEIVPAITAPVCLVEVKKNPALEVIHNIAEEYARIKFEDTAGNLSWILADMAVYEELFPDSENVLSGARKEEGMKEVVAFLATATRPGDLAKGILALRSLGYDARKLYTAEFEKIDAVAKLTTLVDAQDTDVTNIYTLPYVMLALQQAADYATETQISWLIESALASKNAWQATTDPEYGYLGTDAMTPMLLALAPYYETNADVAAVIDETVGILKAEQREDGLIDGFEGYEPASTGLAICALSALGMDAKTITNGGENLIDGLLSTVNDAHGFPNAFATEQGFRGLLAWCLLAEGAGKAIYDFSDDSMNEANVTGAKLCPVVFDINASHATVTIVGKRGIADNTFDLAAGSYAYTVSASGYTTATGTITVSAEEEAARVLKKVAVTMSQVQGVVGGLPSGGTVTGGVGGGTTQSGGVVSDGKEPAQMELTEKTFPDVKETDWYFTAVKYVYENSLFRGTENGFEPDTAMSRAMLVTVLHRFAAPEGSAGENPFEDVPENQWYTDGIKWAVKNHIVSGVSEAVFDPDAGITREQLAVILYRYAAFCGYDVTGTDLTGYLDAEEISDYAVDAVRYAVAKGIISGKTETALAPRDGATRAEVATMLMRFSAGAR